MKIQSHQFAIGLIGGVLGALLIFTLLFAYNYATAAPSSAPPTGNPTFPVAGPTGPTGLTGPQGPAASQSLACITKSSTTPGATVSCDAGYSVTGMIGCRLPSLESAPATSISDTSVTFNNSGPCSAANYVRCCQIQ